MNAIAAIKILVADDSATVRKLIRDFAGHLETPVEVAEADDGPSCLEQLEATRFDMAFIDVHMPGMTGIEALCHARHSGNDTFVVIMSGEPKDGIVDIARQLQAYDFIRKPFRRDELANIFRTYERIVKPVRALLVDDSATVRKVIGRIIEQSIFRVSMEEAPTGFDAVELCKEGLFDVVFLDMNMPGFDGPETLARLRSKNPHARVIVNSSEPEEAVRKRFGNQRIEVFLKKPFYPKDVDRAMRVCFDLPAPYQIDNARVSAS